MSTPEVTVVVATRNRARLLPRLVAALEAQLDAPPFELVVADDASTDDTPGVLERIAARTSFPTSIVRHDRRKGPGPGRNAGWRRGRGGMVLFTDDDCVPRPGWIAGLVSALNDHDFAQGATIPAPDQRAGAGPFSRSLEVLGPTGFFQTCNMGYRRELLEATDGFDERFDRPAGEDTDLALRCLDKGAAFIFEPEAIVEHDVRPSSLATAIKDTWRWQGVVGAVARHPELRAKLGSRWFWKPTHPKALAAVGGIGVAAVGCFRRQPATLAAGAAMAVPYVRHRVLLDPVDPSRYGRLRFLGPVFLVDVAEVVALARGSLKYRTLYL